MSYKKTSKPSHYRRPLNDAVLPGIIEFRLLCPTSAAGGVIGRSGIVIMNLEKDSNTFIWFDDVISSTCKDRLVHITGSSILNRNFMFSDKEVAVSAAQEALLRVFDCMVEVDPPNVEGGMVRCRLLVRPGLVGAVIGHGGTRIAKITKESGGFIKILGLMELLPPCARPSDEMILISGGRLAVMKALLAVSQCIQQKITHFMEGTNGASIHRPSIKMEIGDAAAVDGRVNEEAVTEVVFKLLCS